MADYWVSQERKYCDFCKCWIANNRPSVEFHEKGRRHQENVKKRLKNITKNSFKAQKELEKEDVTLKQMEKAALESYKRDIENNADMTSVAINQKLKDENLQIKGSTKVWQQLKSKEGDFYYWNTVTNATSWEVPAEGFMSVEEQRDESFEKAKKDLEAAEKERRKQGLLRAQQLKQEEEEERARLAREKLKERRVVDDLPPMKPAPIIEPGNPSPYGKWETIKETPMVDLQLPEQEYYECPIVYEPEPIVKEFKEKTVESLGNETGETTFKKRKINFGNRKNARQRLED
ncbi:WW domain-binding protein 4-like isoform X2 [Coccinella septempunctata]|uniref:WW domain-binding protein 4-like isoform X2 n=1 Tax=Coccinella septempunctata TaxID=41139 RepID=UPI001D087BE2|nr:WW domain-binding protein 4-like isoform X2 [Coccinella septempunctata]